MHAGCQSRRELDVLLLRQVRNKEGEISRRFEPSYLKRLRTSTVQGHPNRLQYRRQLDIRQ